MCGRSTCGASPRSATRFERDASDIMACWRCVALAKRSHWMQQLVLQVGMVLDFLTLELGEADCHNFSATELECASTERAMRQALCGYVECGCRHSQAAFARLPMISVSDGESNARGQEITSRAVVIPENSGWWGPSQVAAGVRRGVPETFSGGFAFFKILRRRFLKHLGQ